MTFRRFFTDHRVRLLVMIILVIVAIRWSGVAGSLSVETLRDHREELIRWVQGHIVLASLSYTLLYITAVAFSLPGAVVLTLAGGFLFGAILGTLLTVTGATIGASLIFLFARTLFGDNALDRFGAPAAKLASGIRRNAASYLLVLRLVPLFPFFLVNLVPAFVGISLTTYVVTTFFGIIPGTVVFSLAGAGLGSVLDQGEAITPSSILTPQMIAGLVGLAALSLAAIPIKNHLAARHNKTPL